MLIQPGPQTSFRAIQGLKTKGITHAVKVLHIGKFYPPHNGGMESHLRQLVSQQVSAAKVEVLVASDSWKTTIESLDGATITRVGSFGHIASMPITPMITWLVRKHHADIVHLHTPNPAGAAALFAANPTGAIVVTHHADTLGRELLRKFSDPFVRHVMERAKRIIVTSHRYLDTSTELRPFLDKCVVVPLGVDPEKFCLHDHEMITRIRQQYGERLVLAVGRLVPYKGFEYLIESMQQVDGQLVIIGSGPLESSLASRVVTCGVDSKVSFISRLSESSLCCFYKAASVLAMPSITRAEAFGIVQMEAMASGLPVVNTEIPSGVPEVSVHLETGLTVPPANPLALARAINTLLDNPEVRRRFGEAGKAKVQREYSLRMMSMRTFSVYEHAMILSQNAT